MPQGPNPLEASINMFYGTRANQMPPPNPSFPHPNQRTMTAGGITPAAMANDMQQQHFQLLAGNAAHAAPPNSAVYAMSMMAPSSPPRRPLPENSLLAHPAYLHVQGTAREPTGHPALVGGSAIGSPPPVLPNTDARLKHPDHPAFAGSRPRSPVKPHGGALDSPRRANSRERDRDGGDWGGDPEEDPWEDRPMKPLFLQRRLVNRRELAGLIGQSPDIFSYLYGGDVKGPGATGAIPGDAGRRGSVFAETGGALGGAGLPREGEDLIPSVPSAGYYPLLDRDFEKRGGPVDWSLEASDPLQADQLVFHFLKFKPVSRAVFSVLPPGASASGAGVGASARPFDFSARVHFVLRFFIFPPLCTSPAVVRHTPPLHSTGLQSRPDDPSENGDGSVLKGADGRGLLLRYLVAPRRPPRRRGATDPYRMAERGEVDERRLDRYRHQVAAGPERVSVTGEREGGEDEADFAPAPPSHLELCQYLHGRCAEVEVWHTDGCIQLGSAFIPLSGLIRQQRPVVKEVFDYPVTDALTGELQGFITVLAGNVGKRPVHAHSDAPPGSVLAEVERQEEEEERERDRQRVHTAAGGVFTKQIPGVSAGRKGGRPARFKGTRLRTRVDDEADEIEAKMNEEKSNLMRAEEEMEGKRESEAPEYPKPLSDPSSSMKEMRLRIMKEKARRGLIFRFDPREDQLNRLSVVSPQKGRGRSPSPRRGGGGGGGGGGTFDDPEKDRAARRRAQMEKVQEQREMMQREIRLAKAQKLSLVAEAREARFPLYVRALLDEFMREKLVVHPTLGVPLYFTIEFHNPFDQDTHFLLQIRHACEPPTDSGAFSALSDSPKMKPKSPTSIALEKDPPPTHPLPLVVPVASSRNRGRQLLDSLGGPVEPLVQPELTVCEDPNEWYEGVSRQAAFVQNMGGPMRLEDRRQVEEDMLGFGKVPRDRGNADCHACDDRKHSYAFGEPRPTFGLLSKSKRTAVAPQPPHRQQHWQFILKPFEKVFVPFRYFSVQTEAPMQYMVSGKEMKQIAAQEAALEREAEKDGRDRKGPSKALEGPSPPTGVRRAAMSSLEVMRVWSRMERDFRRRVVLSFATSNGQVMRETDVQVSPRPFVLDGSYRFFAEEDTTLLQEVTAAVPLPLPARGDRLRAQKVKEELRIVREEMAREGEGSDEYDAFQRWREMNAYGEGSREGFSSSAVGGGGSSSLLLGSHMICTDSNVSLEATESACPLSLFSDFDEDGRGLLNGGDGGFAEELPPDAEGGRLDAAEEAEWRTLNGKQKYTAVRIRIRCHVTSSRKRTFLILFYHHSAPRRLAATFLFSVQPVRRESTALPVGNKLEKHVAIPSSIFKRFGGLPRPVRFFTTDSWLAVVSDPPLGEAAKVSPLASTEFRLTVTPYRQGLSRCRVHALDALTGELLNAWILSVDALPPAVRDCHTIYAQRGRISRHTVPFRSPLSYDATIHLSTSDPLILQASSPFRIAGNGQCDMELFVCLDEYTLNLSQQLFAVNALEARRQREVGRGPFGTGVRTNGQEDSSFGGPPWVGWHPGGLGRGPASVEVYLFLRSRDGELQETDKVKIFIRQ